MLTAQGVTQSADAWARDLGVSTYTVEHAISAGLSMQDVFGLYTSSYCGPPSTPPPRRAPVVATPSGPILQSPAGGVTFRALCTECAEASRRYYDRRHLEHRVRQTRAQEEDELMFQFVHRELFVDPRAGLNHPAGEQQAAPQHAPDVAGGRGGHNEGYQG